MKYLVTIPLAGHAHFTIEAESETEAREKALKVPIENAELEYDLLEEVNEGNVCNFPVPWEVTVEEA